jgi:uncharacterized damage-inducible protein DinB
MQSDVDTARQSAARSLSGTSAHLEPPRVLEDLEWQVAVMRPAGVSHSVAQVLDHMVFWQAWILRALDGKRSSMAGGWRGAAPTSRARWERAVERFKAGLDELSRRAREGSPFDKPGRISRLELLQTAASHNSHHAGQIVILRQMLGAWPISRRRSRGARS